MTFGFVIADLILPEDKFTVTSRYGEWEFVKNSWYEKILPDLEKGQVGNTFSAFNESVLQSVSDKNFATATSDLQNICLLLSFLNATCVTPTGSAQYSFCQMITMGDSFIPARAIRGLPSIKPSGTTGAFLSNSLPAMSGSHCRWLRLLMFHWISAISSYTIEDLFLAVCVQFDIVKQLERVLSGNLNIEYAEGMRAASTRLGITPLQDPFQKMRNDLVHEGRLSGSKFKNKTKADCASVVANCLNWLDEYVLASTNSRGYILQVPRWKAEDFLHYLPAFSLAP